MSEDTSVAHRVVALLTQRLGIAPEMVKPTAELADDLGVDSVDAVEFTLGLEREFNVALADGSVRWLPQNTPEETVKAMITRNGGEVVPWP